MSIEEDKQSLSPGTLVELYKLDTTLIGGTEIWYFVEGKKLNGTDVYFDGIRYEALDIEANGFEVTGTGQLPQPKLRLANATRLIAASVRDLGDLVGAELTRTRTFYKYLDGEPSADPSMFFLPDVFRIEQKTVHSKYEIEWKIAAVIDQQGRTLPGRQVLRNSCGHSYRYYDVGVPGFDYTLATCPYNGSSYFDDQGNVVAEASDKCGKRLSDCKLRYTNGDALPFWGFPGVSRARNM